MKIESPPTSSCNPDMTPMIDCTFQLIIFFMLTLNFSQDQQSEIIKLPSSDIAKPSAETVEKRITLQLTNEGKVLVGGDVVPVAAVDKVLKQEKRELQRQGKKANQTTVIIRADSRTKTGKVQELIKFCQLNGFEKFVLRAKYTGRV